MYKVIGVKDSSFTGKDGKQVSGVTVHAMNCDYILTYGHAVERLFIHSNHGYAASDFKLGSGFDVVYNRFGKIQSVSFCDA